MQIDIQVQTPLGSRNFSCLAHRTVDATNRFIEKEFYEKWCPDSIPQGTHHELELLTDIIKKPKSVSAHIHVNPQTKKRFVCWTGHLPTIQNARALFSMWCVGVTYSIMNDADFATVFAEAEGSTSKFLEIMAEKHGIKVNQ